MTKEKIKIEQICKSDRIFRVKTAYLLNHRWHVHYTRWHANADDAWKENDEFLKTVNYLESKSAIQSKLRIVMA